MKKGREEEIRAFVRLLDIMDELRVKCPWDREQTTESLRPLTIEETYELSDAIMNSDDFNISKELGDIMLHIVFYAKIGSEKGTFNITDVMDRCSDKLVYRHPHVFAETQVSGARDVIENWEQLKRKEKDGNKTILSGVPSSLPSIVKAYRVQDKVRAVGFDWEKREQVWDKVREEIGEFEAEMKRRFPDGNVNKNETVGDEKMEGEFGDLLFSIINAARLYNINPDTALEMTNRKFIGRFGYLESEAQKRGLSLKKMTLQEMDQIWEEAKKLEES
ncbi:MAG: nucleoside triphosphate pyrophosphohydrolase [Bacteroidales bacterium]|nr:nucleoside triphosphate pyrophosphohydrolase [Bacteroidales bacterium]